MGLTVGLFGVLSGFELLLWLPPLWRLRKPLAGILLVVLSVLSGTLVADNLEVWTVVLAVLSLYRVVNLLRLVEGRIQADYLYHATRRTSLWLIGLQAAGFAAAKAGSHFQVRPLAYFYLLAAVQLAGALVLFVSTSRHLRTTKPPVLASGVADRDLPSLTVAIPARNETTDLQACLESLVASSYPKLEILVLDDCSQNKRTSEIIRGFAQAGVRFIAGEAPPGHWLAKNYAYEQLSKQASGELLLFCGVDVRFEKDSLDNLVRILLQEQKSMISVLPRNLSPKRQRMASLLVQPSRYAWELALPRWLLKRPPVLSTCWLITKEALLASGGFAAASRKIVPESYLARQTALSDDGYRLFQSDRDMGISSLKGLGEQQATATRTRYPQLRRRPEMVAIVGLAELAILVLPLAVFIAALATQNWLLGSLAVLARFLENIAYAKIINLTYRKTLLRGLWLLPIAALYDLAVLNYSMRQYEFGEVTWKGRNVCLPVMRVIPDAPSSN